VDKKRIFLVGHSMGAAQVVAAANRDPAKYAGIAALGGGGSVRASEAMTRLPFFVGIGREDFALRGARSMKSSLEKAKVEKVVYQEHDDIEHLVIVQLCLPEVFRLFDEVVKK
jgi:predicted peptidase